MRISRLIFVLLPLACAPTAHEPAADDLTDGSAGAAASGVSAGQAGIAGDASATGGSGGSVGGSSAVGGSSGSAGDDGTAGTAGAASSGGTVTKCAPAFGTPDGGAGVGDAQSQTAPNHDLAVGGAHSCAIKANGALWCWGANDKGQLGDGSTIGKNSPIEVTALGSSVVSISAGQAHTCARKADGTLWCWGLNDAGQLGIGTTSNSLVPLQVSSLGASVASVSAGYAHTCAVKADGTLWCWGSNNWGQLCDFTNKNRISPIQVTQLGAPVSSVAASVYHTCAVKADATLSCWGLDSSGELGDGTTGGNGKSWPVPVTALGAAVVSVAGTCAIVTDGTLWCWGGGKVCPAQVSGLSGAVTEVSAGWHTCAITTDGTAWCGVMSSPAKVDGLDGTVTALAVGSSNACARTSAGTLWCWGGNGSGQLGDGTVAEPPDWDAQFDPDASPSPPPPPVKVLGSWP
jgi:alpha-tubulin suppressor-like RCC1 family protein